MPWLSIPILAFLAGPAPAALPQEDFLLDLAHREGWSVVADPAGRWRLVHTAIEPSLAAEAEGLLAAVHDRLTSVLGDQEPWTREASTLFLVGDQAAEDALCAAIGEARPHLAAWADAIRVFPRFQHWAPLMALVRHDASTAGVERPAAWLAHMAVQLDVCRRRGRMPFWVGEALGYALQDEILGEVHGVSFHPGGALDEDWPRRWRSRAREALLEPGLDAAALAEGSGSAWDERRAWQQFGAARWWLDRAADRLPAMLDAYAALRGGTALDVPFEPAAAEQQRILETSFGADWLPRAAVYLSTLPDRGGAEGQELALVQALAVLQEQGLKTWTDRDERVVLYSDFRTREARAALARCRSALRFLDGALGEREVAAPLRILLVTGEGTWNAVCERLAEALPGQAAYLDAAREGTGFTLYAPAISAYYHDPRVQEEARPANSAAHNLVHLELARRYGRLPLWLAEGVACATEERVFGEVWGTWNRDAFVYTVSHGDWRRSASRAVGRAGGLDGLYAYTASPYEEGPAYLAFAFSLYGLEKDRKGFRRLLEDLAAAARAERAGGRFQPTPEQMAALVSDAWGEDFEQAFRNWWRKPPKRPRSR